jgi:chromosome segregation ATPase
MEMAKISESKADSGSGKTGLQSVAEKELRELFSRLGEELIEPEQEIDFALNVDELSKEQLKNELEFIQTQVRDKAKQDQRLREKWKKSIEALREKMLRLEQDKESMEEEMDALRNEMERLRRKNQELLALLNRAQNFIQSIEQLKDKLNQETETLHDFLHDLERIRQK